MFNYHHVRLESLGYLVPENVVRSTDLERELSPVYERFGLHEGRLELMTGIRERRFWNDNTLPSDASAEAGRIAMRNAGVEPDEIECLIHGAVSRDFLEPATASVVHHHLRLAPRSMFYDLSNACLGFVNGMISLANMIELGQVRRGLVVAAESGRQLVRSTVDWLLNRPQLTRRELKAAFASLTIGSGAVAAVLAHDSVSQVGHPLLGGAVRTASQNHGLCRGSQDTGFKTDAPMLMNTDAETLLVSGCALAAQTWVDFQRTLEWDAQTVDRIFTHQVGLAHRDSLYQALGLDVGKDFSTFEFLGNVGSVSLPLTMAMGVERRPPEPGARIALLGIGSGLSCVMLGVRW
jgi:3-oxoacyl-[acyl-carrier-protein] synthase-3